MLGIEKLLTSSEIFNLWIHTMLHSVMNHLQKQTSFIWGGVPRDVVANKLEFDIVVIEIKFLSCYFVLFRTYTLEKAINLHGLM